MGHGGTGADAYLCMDYISFVLSPSPYPSFHPHPTPRFNPPPPLTSTPLPPFTPAPARNYKEAGRLNEELKAKVAKEKELAVEVDSLLASSEATSLRLDDVKRQLSATKEEVTRREQEEGKGGERREVRLLHMVTLSVAMLTVARRGIREEGAHSAVLVLWCRHCPPLRQITTPAHYLTFTPTKSLTLSRTVANSPLSVCVC